MRITGIAPQSACALLCATPATDLRTSDVRSIVRVGDVALQGKRVPVTAPTTGMGHVDGFSAGAVPGSLTWSPPI